MGQGNLPGETDRSQSMLAEQYGKHRDNYYGTMAAGGGRPTIIETDDFNEIAAYDLGESPGTGRVHFAENGIRKKKTRPNSADFSDRMSADIRRLTVNRNVIRSVRLSFTNTDKQKVIIYQEMKGGMHKKVKQLLANATF